MTQKLKEFFCASLEGNQVDRLDSFKRGYEENAGVEGIKDMFVGIANFFKGEDKLKIKDPDKTSAWNMYKELSKTVDKTIGNRSWLANKEIKPGPIDAGTFGKYLTVNGKIPENVVDEVSREFKDFKSEFDSYYREAKKELQGQLALINLYEKFSKEPTQGYLEKLKKVYDGIPKAKEKFKFTMEVKLGGRVIEEKQNHVNGYSISAPKDTVKEIRALTKDEIIKAVDLAKQIVSEVYDHFWVSFGHEELRKYTYDPTELMGIPGSPNEIDSENELSDFAAGHSWHTTGHLYEYLYETTPIHGRAIAMIQIARSLLIWAGKSIKGFNVKY